MERLGNRVAARQQQQHQQEGTLAVQAPAIQLHPPSAFPGIALEPISLAEPRSASRQTARSASAAGSDAGSAVFEYDAHLSRNASLRAAVAAREMEHREGDLGGLSGEEVLDSPVRDVPQARYTLTDSGLSLGREIGDQQRETPRVHEPQHFASDPHHTADRTPESSTSSSMIPVMISPAEETPPTPETAHPLLPALGEVFGASYVGDRRQDSMSRFPQGVMSGTSSSYFPRNRESADADGERTDLGGDLRAWQEQQAQREFENQREVEESEGYFEHFDVDQREELEGDARSDVTEKMARGGDEVDRSRPGSLMS